VRPGRATRVYRRRVVPINDWCAMDNGKVVIVVVVVAAGGGGGSMRTGV